ncbi:MAG: TPM domain-containing protein [Taibaiella sp.]|nr:TPM domain-containing protein [Taibaiella sp.]
MFPFGNKKPLLDEDAQHQIVATIKSAESNTTGEIRVFVEHKCSYMDAMDRAKELFARLNMAKTHSRNAVIVYIALTDRQYALFGDVEIYQKAGGPVFWEKAASKLKAHLRDGRLTEGMCDCINELGMALAMHFPYDASIPRNELPDEIVFGK